MRVVITGGCGFLGRRVALRLHEHRDVDELVLFDNAPSALPLRGSLPLPARGERVGVRSLSARAGEVE